MFQKTKKSYPKLKDLDGKILTIEKVFAPRYERWNPSLKVMEKRDDVSVRLTDDEKNDGWRWKLGMALNEDRIISMSYSQVKSLLVTLGLEPNDFGSLEKRSFTLVWNKLEGLESKYFFMAANDSSNSSPMSVEEENDMDEKF